MSSKLVTLATFPFRIPSAFLRSGIRNGMGVDIMLILTFVSLIGYFGIGYFLQRAYPNRKILNNFFILWIIGVIFFFFRDASSDEKEIK